MLADKGLVELLPRRGARVTDMTRILSPWLNDVLENCSPLVVRRATENRTSETLKPIAAAVREMEDCAVREDVDGYMAAIMKFGLASCVASRNQVLEKMIIYIWPITNRGHVRLPLPAEGGTQEEPQVLPAHPALLPGGGRGQRLDRWSYASWWSTTSKFSVLRMISDLGRKACG